VIRKSQSQTFFHPYATQAKRERLVSFDHRYRMCHLAFEQLNDVSTAVPASRVVISDAEYMSWKEAVKTV
jgi:nicotinic acid mononucleotide adenylyltransferase